MLDDAELALLGAQQGRYASDNYKHYETQRELLVKYKELVSEYLNLKKSYEAVAGGKQEDSFVLVLIDGDTYKFDEDVISRREAGGTTAAQLLLDSVNACLIDTLYEQCRVTARVYCNVAETSKVLSRTKLVGAEKRSLGPFAAGFSSSIDHFDFIDAGDRADAVVKKINEAVNFFGNVGQCKHILLGASNVRDYSKNTASHSGKLTLVDTAPFDTDKVRKSLTPGSLPFRHSAAGHVNDTSVSNTEPPRIQSKWAPPPATADQTNADDSRSKTATNRRPNPFHSTNSSTDRGRPNNNDFPKTTDSFITCKPENEGQIPINRSGQRLDPHIPKPSGEAWAAFTARAGGAKLCNDFHLQGECDAGDDCRFDHDPIDDLTLDALRYLARSIPCHKGPDCRMAHCVNGHICTKFGCRGSKHCKLRPWMHGLDTQLDAWVTATNAVGNGERRNGAIFGQEEDRSTNAGVSLRDTHRGLEDEQWSRGWNQGNTIPERQRTDSWTEVRNGRNHPHRAVSPADDEWKPRPASPPTDGWGNSAAPASQAEAGWRGAENYRADRPTKREVHAGWSTVAASKSKENTSFEQRPKLTPNIPRGPKHQTRSPQAWEADDRPRDPSGWDGAADVEPGTETSKTTQAAETVASTQLEAGADDWPTSSADWHATNSDLISFNNDRKIEW